MQNFQKAFIKTLTESDVNPDVSNQHELHGVSKLQSIFCAIEHGDSNKYGYEATIRIGHSGKKQNINLTWYNARANNPNRHEYRLYYYGSIIETLEAGDDIMIGLTFSNQIEIIIFSNHNNNYTEWTEMK